MNADKSSIINHPQSIRRVAACPTEAKSETLSSKPETSQKDRNSKRAPGHGPRTTDLKPPDTRTTQQPNALSPRRQERQENQVKRGLNLCDLCVLARDITFFLWETCGISRSKSAQENKILISSNAKTECPATEPTENTEQRNHNLQCPIRNPQSPLLLFYSFFLDKNPASWRYCMLGFGRIPRSRDKRTR